MSSFFRSSNGLSRKENIGIRVIERFIGNDGLLLWTGLERCIVKHYGVNKMHEIREAIFKLALKAAKLHARRALTMASVATAQMPLMEVLYLAHSCARARNESNVVVNPLPLSNALVNLHDVLLPILRRHLRERSTKQPYARRLTNAFIDVGVESFLKPVMNADSYREERELIACATRALLINFGHPEFSSLGQVHAQRCARRGCNQLASYNNLCTSHAVAKMRADFSRPTLRAFLSDSTLLNAVNQFIRDQNDVYLKNQFAFYLAAEEYRSIRTPRMRLGRAKIIVARYLRENSVAYIGEAVATPDECDAINSAITAAEVGDADPRQTLFMLRTASSKRSHGCVRPQSARSLRENPRHRASIASETSIGNGSYLFSSGIPRQAHSSMSSRPANAVAVASFSNACTVRPSHNNENDQISEPYSNNSPEDGSFSHLARYASDSKNADLRLPSETASDSSDSEVELSILENEYDVPRASRVRKPNGRRGSGKGASNPSEHDESVEDIPSVATIHDIPVSNTDRQCIVNRNEISKHGRRTRDALNSTSGNSTSHIWPPQTNERGESKLTEFETEHVSSGENAAASAVSSTQNHTNVHVGSIVRGRSNTLTTPIQASRSIGMNAVVHSTAGARHSLPADLFAHLQHRAFESIEAIFLLEFIHSQLYRDLASELSKELMTPEGPAARGMRAVTQGNAYLLLNIEEVKEEYAYL